MKYTIKVHKMSWWAAALVLPAILPGLLLTLVAFLVGLLASIAAALVMPWTWFISWIDGHKGLVKKGDSDE